MRLRSRNLRRRQDFKVPPVLEGYQKDRKASRLERIESWVVRQAEARQDPITKWAMRVLAALALVEVVAQLWIRYH
jgi:hypothetical protein